MIDPLVLAQLSDMSIAKWFAIVRKDMLGNARSTNDIVSEEINYSNSLARFRATTSTHLV